MIIIFSHFPSLLVFYDFESLTFDKSKLDAQEDLESIDDTSFTKVIADHKPVIWSMMVNSFLI